MGEPAFIDSEEDEVRSILDSPLKRFRLDWLGRRIVRLGYTAKGLVAFLLITLTVCVTKFNVATRVVRPMVRAHVYRAGVGLLPMTCFLGCALGLVVIGQTVSLMSRVGAQGYLGTVMVTAVVRELGPLATALLVLARIGTAYVVEMGTARALGEVEAMEALGIDPVHYLVVPRVIGLALSISALTVYFILVALFSGYLFAFLEDVPLRPGAYFQQLAVALRWEDFALLALKSASFGFLIAVITCYQGLARPLRLEEVSAATTRAVVYSVVACVLLDAVFIVIYLVM